MTVRFEAQRCLIPSSIHGFSTSAEVRGACYRDGDLYLYVVDGGALFLKKVALSGQPDGFVAASIDLSDFTLPFSISLTEDSQAVRRTFPGLCLYGDAVLVFHPWIRGDMAALYVSTAALDGSKVNEKNAVVETITSQLNSPIIYLPYSSIQAVLPLSVSDTDYSMDFLVAYGEGTSSIVRKNYYSFAGRQYLQNSNFMVQFRDKQAPMSGILRVDESKTILLASGPDGVATDLRFVPLGFDIGDAVDWSTPGTMDFIVVLDYDQLHNEYFGILYFNDLNDIVVDKYRDHVSSKSSPRSIFNLNKPSVRYGDSEPVKIDLEFYDFFGYKLPDDTKVVVEIDRPEAQAQKFVLEDLDIIDLESSGFSGFSEVWTDVLSQASDWSSLASLEAAREFEADFMLSGNPALGPSTFKFWYDSTTDEGWFIRVETNGSIELVYTWVDNSVSQETVYDSGGLVDTDASSLKLIAGISKIQLFQNGVLVIEALHAKWPPAGLEFSVEGPDISQDVTVHPYPALALAEERFIFPTSTGVSSTHPESFRLDFANLRLNKFSGRLAELFKVDDSEFVSVFANGEYQELFVSYRVSDTEELLGSIEFTEGDTVSVAFLDVADRRVLELYVNDVLLKSVDVTESIGEIAGDTLEILQSQLSVEYVAVYDLSSDLGGSVPGDYSDPSLVKTLDSDFQSGFSGWTVTDVSGVVSNSSDGVLFADPTSDDANLPRLDLASPLAWSSYYAIAGSFKLPEGRDSIKISLIDSDSGDPVVTFSITRYGLFVFESKIGDVHPTAEVEFCMLLCGDVAGVLVDHVLRSVRQIGSKPTNVSVRVEREENFVYSVDPSCALSRVESGPFFDPDGNPYRTKLILTTEDNQATFYLLPPPGEGEVDYVEKIRVVAGYEESDVPPDVIAQPVPVSVEVYKVRSGDILESQSLPKGESAIYALDVPYSESLYLDAMVLSPSSDAVLYAKLGNIPTDVSFDYMSDLGAGDEWISAEEVSSGLWYFRVEGSDELDYSFSAAYFTSLSITTIQVGEEVYPISFRERLQRIFEYEVTNTDSVRLVWSFGTDFGDVQVFTEYGALPSPGKYSQTANVSAGSSAEIVIQKPVPGNYYLLLRPYPGGAVPVGVSVLISDESPYLLTNAEFVDIAPQTSEIYVKLPVDIEARAWMFELTSPVSGTLYDYFDALPSDTQNLDTTSVQADAPVSLQGNRETRSTPDFTGEYVYFLFDADEKPDAITVRATYCGNETPIAVDLQSPMGVPVCIGGEHRVSVDASSGFGYLGARASQNSGVAVLLYKESGPPSKSDNLYSTLIPSDSSQKSTRLIVENPPAQTVYFGYAASSGVIEGGTWEIDGGEDPQEIYQFEEMVGSVVNLSAAPATWKYVTINVPAGAASLEVFVSANNPGENYAYLRFGGLTTIEESDMHEKIGENGVSFVVENPRTGVWCVGIYVATVNLMSSGTITYRIVGS